MKKTILFLIISLNFVFANAQTKKFSYDYNHFMNLKGTVYSLATVESWSKFEKVKNSLLFINTETGETKEISFPNGATLRETTQIKIDSLSINLVLITARTIDWNNKKGIDWSDPQQIFVFSPSGDNMQQLTEDNYFVRSWSVNEYTGTLIISGYYDINKNNEKDKDEDSSILLYDLKTLQLKKKL
jgi:hypothetical protein